MEYPFSFYNPTRIWFGTDALTHLADEAAAFPDPILLVAGGGSIRKNGVYDAVRAALPGRRLLELWDVPPNPTRSKVAEGIALCRAQKPGLILAVGGGSVVDCAKAIAVGAPEAEDFWERFFLRRKEAERALPLGVVLTMVGTGSEMNGNAVVTCQESRRKLGMYSPAASPHFSLLNPEFTYSLPAYQMVSGICDIASHILELYLSPSDLPNLSDALAETLLRELMRDARIAVQNPRDAAARSNLMWCATLALSGLLHASKTGDWMAHQMEHQLGAYTDCAHGMGLAAISPAYYRFLTEKSADFARRFARLSHALWALPDSGDARADARRGVDALEDFFRAIGATVSLSQLGLSADSPLEEIAGTVRLLPGGYYRLNAAEIAAIFRSAL